MKYTILSYFLLFDIFAIGQGMTPPGRVGWLGAHGKYSKEGLKIDSLANGSSLGSTQIRPGDLLMSVNEISVNSLAELRRSMRNVREKSELSIVFKRDGEIIRTKLPAAPLPFLTDPEMDIKYGWVSFRSGALRSVSYAPKNNSSQIPYILLIPGYGCGSIENYQNSYNGQLIRQLTKAGFGIFTVEKSGVGDSYNCKPCEEVDLATDIESFEEAYKKMAALPDTDTSQLYIFGHSMGGVIAPLVANEARIAGKPSAGVIAFATVYRPWFEFLLEMHRVQAPLNGKSYEETEQFVRTMQKVYYEFFVNKKSPEQIAAIPALHEPAVSEMDFKPGSNLLWGRHWKFWQQLDSINLAHAWSSINTRVLSVFGGADYEACSELDHLLITKAVNSAKPGYATHVKIPDIDHFMTRNKDWAASMKNLSNAEYMRLNFHEGLGNEIIKWIQGRKP